MSKEVMKLALEALEYIEHNYMSLPAPAEKAITALREALAEQPAPVAKPHEQEPVAWVCYGLNNKYDIDFFEDDIADLAVGTKLYTQAQRTWVGLNDEEKSDLWCESTGRDCVNEDTHVFADAIEAKLKERNT